MYNAPCFLVDASDFIFGLSMCIHLLHICIKYLMYMAYIPNLLGIFVSITYYAITCVAETAVGCILAYKCKNVGSICQCRMLAI